MPHISALHEVRPRLVNNNYFTACVVHRLENLSKRKKTNKPGTRKMCSARISRNEHVFDFEHLSVFFKHRENYSR